MPRLWVQGDILIEQIDNSRNRVELPNPPLMDR